MLSIRTINCLKNKLKNVIGKENFIDALPYIRAYNGNDWGSICSLDLASFNKNKNNHKTLISKDENFEVFLIKWYPRSNIPLHDHSNNGCIMKILKGELEEGRYKYGCIKDNYVQYMENKLIQGDVSFIHNQMGLHTINNNTDETAYSLHIYSPPGHQTKYFDT